MSRIVLRLIGAMVSGCIGVLLLVLALGRLLILPDNELLFDANLDSTSSHIYRMDIAHQLIYPVTKDSSVDSQPVWSPDGQQIAFVSNRDGQYTIYLMDAQGRAIHRLTDDNNYAYGPSWSPDERYIAYLTKQFPISPELMLTDLQSGKTRRLTDNREAENSPKWSPDSRRLAFAYDTTSPRFENIFSLDIQTGDMQPLVATTDYERSPNWSADGRSILYIAWGSNPGVYIWDVVYAQSTLLYPLEGLDIRNPNWSPDGRFIIYAPLSSNNNNHIFVLDVVACLQQSQHCTPKALSLIPGTYANPQWRPQPL